MDAAGAGYGQDTVNYCVRGLENEIKKSVCSSSEVVLARATRYSISPYYDSVFDQIVKMYAEHYSQKWRYDLLFALQILRRVDGIQIDLLIQLD